MEETLRNIEENWIPLPNDYDKKGEEIEKLPIILLDNEMEYHDNKDREIRSLNFLLNWMNVVVNLDPKWIANYMEQDRIEMQNKGSEPEEGEPKENEEKKMNREG